MTPAQHLSLYACEVPARWEARMLLFEVTPSKLRLVFEVPSLLTMAPLNQITNTLTHILHVCTCILNIFF